MSIYDDLNLWKQNLLLDIVPLGVKNIGNSWAKFKALRKYWKYVSQEFYLNIEKLQTLLRLSFLLVANIEVCPEGGSCLCRWCSKCRPESLTHIEEWQNRNYHLPSKCTIRSGKGAHKIDTQSLEDAKVRRQRLLGQSCLGFILTF